MEKPLTPVPTGPGEESGNPPSLETAEFVVSDLHLGAGKIIEIRQSHTVRYTLARWFHLVIVWFLRRIGRKIARLPPPETIEVRNQIEDFPYDREFADFIEKLVAMCGHAATLGLALMGDCFDRLATTRRGRFDMPPTERNCAAQMCSIIDAHSGFFDALSWFIRANGRRLRIFTGNHDSFLNWPAVQALLVTRIAGDDAELAARIHFVDYRSRYLLLEDEVGFDHAMNAEKHTALDPDKPFITERFGKTLPEPELNEPIGNVMTAEVSNAIKMLGNETIGALEVESESWDEALRNEKFSWAIRSLGTLLSFCYRQSKKGLGEIFKVVRTTLPKPKSKYAPSDVELYGRRMLKELKGKVRAVITAHSHIAMRVTDEDGLTLVNTGSWARRMRLVWPEDFRDPATRKWYGEGMRAFKRYLYSAKAPFGRQLSVFVLYLFLGGLLVTFLQTSINGAWAYSVIAAKLLVLVFLAFLVLKGITRFFMIKPEVEEYKLFTLALKRRYSDGTLLVDLMRYDPDAGTIREHI